MHEYLWQLLPQRRGPFNRREYSKLNHGCQRARQEQCDKSAAALIRAQLEKLKSAC